MKRQRSRNRGNSGGKPQHNANRAFESNGPEGVKIRGAAQHVFEKYQQLARDALTAGDRVLAESYQQHAEHYFRVLRAVQPQRSASDIIGRDAFASGYDIDFEDENGGEIDTTADTIEAENDRADGRGEWRADNRFEGRPRDDRARDDRPRDDRPRDDRPRDDRPRDDRQRDDRPRERNFNRDDRPRDDRPRDDRPRDERPRNERNDRIRDERPRDDRPREDRPRDDRPREDRPREEVAARDDRPRESRQNDRPRSERPRYDRAERVADPLAVVEPQASPLTSEAEPSSSPFLRSQDGGVSEAPAFLQARPEAPKPEPVAEEEVKPRPRRRRAAPRSFEATGGEESTPKAAEDA
jgi:hypothetical protein